MAEALIDVERNLRLDRLTVPERRALTEFKEKARRDILIGATGGAFVTWFASQKLSVVNRLFVAGGASIASISCGYWSFNRTLYTHIDHFLSMDGTWLQKEFAASVLRRYHNNPKIMNRFSKHFFAEKVYDDSSDIPKLRWRPRKVFEDDAGNLEAATDFHESNSNKSAQNRVVMKESKLVSRPAQKNTDMELIENPFECIFGAPAGTEQILSSSGSKLSRTDPSNTARKRHTHGIKRHHHRRHRKDHHEASEV